MLPVIVIIIPYLVMQALTDGYRGMISSIQVHAPTVI
jgi:hypothetical protein